jgi:hypothetical protein
MLISILRAVPSQNATTYAHWSKYARERDTWMALLRAQLTPRNPPTVKMRMRIHTYRKRKLDYGNLVGGAKPIPDCLVRLGYLKDDSPDWMECAYAQTVVPKGEERTDIEIWPAT